MVVCASGERDLEKGQGGSSNDMKGTKKCILMKLSKEQEGFGECIFSLWPKDLP